MATPVDLSESIQSAPAGLSVADMLARHPGLARRTVQRWLRELVAQGRIRAIGAGRARRYAVAARPLAPSAAGEDVFPKPIPLSADSRDTPEVLSLIARINRVQRRLGVPWCLPPDLKMTPDAKVKSPRGEEAAYAE